jgi:hypothetical protein
MRRKHRTEKERKRYQQEYNAWYQRKNRKACRLASVFSLRNLRKQVLKKLGNKCVECGFADWRALQIDHKKGGGSVDRRKAKSITQYLKSVLKHTHRYQILCANCNWIKRHLHHEFGRPANKIRKLFKRPKRIYK